MSLRRKGMRASGTLALSEGIGYGAAFLRNVLLARLLTKEDFGIAATFAMVITLFEFSGKLGMIRLVVQDKDGDKPDFLAAAQFVNAMTAVVSAGVILAVALPMASLFGLGDQVWSFLVLALVPLLLGSVNLDTRRFERDLRFGPSALVDAIPQVVITLLAWPLALWLGDYRVVLILVILKALLTSLGTHWLAEYRYRWKIHREYIGRMLRFGWPLVVNGFLMFGVLHGDQFIVASFYDMAELGPYAAAASLTLAPTFFFTRVFSSVMLPIMAKAQEEPVVFARRYRLVIAVLCTFSAGYAAFIVLSAESLMQLVFGQKYAGAGVLLAWLTVANAFRNIRIGPTVAAMAKGDSANQMLASFSRVGALLPALAVALMGKPVWMVAATGTIGEALACLASFRRLSRRDKIPISQSLVPLALVVVVVAAAGSTAIRFDLHDVHPLMAISLGLGAALLGSVTLVLALHSSRRELFSLCRRVRTQGWRSCLPWRKPASVAGKPTAA